MVLDILIFLALACLQSRLVKERRSRVKTLADGREKRVMKIACCWMYVISKYGFPPKLENIYKGIREMSNLGFKFIEMEEVWRSRLLSRLNSESYFFGEF